MNETELTGAAEPPKSVPGARKALALTTLAFGCCFAVWMLNGVLVSFLVEHESGGITRAEMGWLLGAPVLTGAILRLPVGIFADRYGGRVVLALVMLVGAGGVLVESVASGFAAFLGSGLLLGVAGSAFAAGAAYTSAWFPKEKQGVALGIFGAGNVGAALTNLVAPSLLDRLTHGGADVEAWRVVPRVYAAALAGMAGLFWLSTKTRLPLAAGPPRTFSQCLAPLRVLRVWRFGLYYFVVFGAFVAISQWLLLYYSNLYAIPLATAGALAAAFALPPNLTRIAGGWLSDRIGARRVMYFVLAGCTVGFALLAVPRMDALVPGQAVFSSAEGVVDVAEPGAVVVSGVRYPIQPEPPQTLQRIPLLVWPKAEFWQAPVVAPGDRVVKRQMIAKGITHIHFQANMGIFATLTILVGSLMGLGMAAVYRHIPQYFPKDVGIVGGVVGMIGGLGGFVQPVLFGYLLGATGLWITCWMLLGALSLGCLVWMHVVVRRMLDRAAPHLAHRFDDVPVDARIERRTLACDAHDLRADLAILRHGDRPPACRLERVLEALDGLECPDAGDPTERHG